MFFDVDLDENGPNLVPLLSRNFHREEMGENSTYFYMDESARGKRSNREKQQQQLRSRRDIDDIDCISQEENLKHTINYTSVSDRLKGVRIFDNVKFYMRDVSYEQLFDERIRLANNVFDHFGSGCSEIANGCDNDRVADILISQLAFGIVKFLNDKILRNEDKIGRVIFRNSKFMFALTSDFASNHLIKVRDISDVRLLKNLLNEDRSNQRLYDTEGPSVGIVEPSDAVFGSGNNNNEYCCDGEESQFDDRWDEMRKQLFSKVPMNVDSGLSCGGDDGDGDSYHHQYYSFDDYDDEEIRNGDADARWGTVQNETAMLLFVDREAIINMLDYIRYFAPANPSDRYRICIDRREDVASGSDGSSKNDKSEVSRNTKHTLKESVKVISPSTHITTQFNNTVPDFKTSVKSLLLLMLDKCLTRSVRNNGEESKRLKSSLPNIHLGIIDTIGEIKVKIQAPEDITARGNFTYCDLK